MLNFDKLLFVLGVTFLISTKPLFGMKIYDTDPINNSSYNRSLERAEEIYDSSYDSSYKLHALEEFIDLSKKQLDNKNKWNLLLHKRCKMNFILICHNGQKGQALFEPILKNTKHSFEDKIEYYGHLSYLYKEAYVNGVLLEHKGLSAQSPSLPHFMKFIKHINMINKLDNEKCVFNEIQKGLIIEIFSSYQKSIYDNYSVEKDKILFNENMNNILNISECPDYKNNKSFTRFIENKFNIFSEKNMNSNIRKKIETMIENEEKLPDYIPFYHGYGDKVGVVYAVYSEILNAYNKYENPINWASRLLTPTQNINDLKYICKSTGYDQGAEFCRNGICATTSILTNHWSDTESAYVTWTRGTVVRARNFFGILKDSLLEAQFNEPAVDIFVDQIESIYKSIYPKGGEVQQIFIHKDVVGELCYLSKTFGSPLSVKEEEITTPTAKQVRDFLLLKQMLPSPMFSEDIFKTCLAFYSRNNIVNSIPEILEKMKSGIIFEIDKKKDERWMQCIQARILFDPAIMIDQTKAKIFTHHTEKEMESELHYFKLVLKPHIAKLMDDRNQGKK